MKSLSYKQIKWLILIIPTVTIGLWEYVRHEFLLPYISMSLGNWLAPIIIFGVSISLLNRLFRIMEQNQADLNEAKAIQAVLLEREMIARQLHDGIAQSLFLLSAQLGEQEEHGDVSSQQLDAFRKTVHQTNEYVRQAIVHLKDPVHSNVMPWMQMVNHLVEELRANTNIKVHFNWTLPEESLTAKEKVELHAIIREALQNVRKHAAAKQVWIKGKVCNRSWECLVIDDGKGFDISAIPKENCYGLMMMKERAQEMNWEFMIYREQGKTTVQLNSIK